MGLTLLFRIRQGSFETGFSGAMQFADHTGRLLGNERPVTLPPAPGIPSSYTRWQPIYEQLGHTRALQVVEGQITHGSDVSIRQAIETCRKATRNLKEEVKIWFQTDSFDSLRNWINAEVRRLGILSEHSSIPVIIHADTSDRTLDLQLYKLPWHFWEIFDDLPTAEPVLAANLDPQIITLEIPIRILAVFGSSEGGLALDDDEQILNQLTEFGAEIKPIRQPTLRELSHLLRTYPCDILFFAGHSFSHGGCEPGVLQIQDSWTVPIEGLEQDLRRAVGQRLKLAIFNSCDGLGIAQYLATLKVPSTIVMREPVPDLVAREFLKCFLEEFSSGKPLYLAVREARSRIHWMESDLIPCPAASWLPIVCQNPNQPELVWATLESSQADLAKTETPPSAPERLPEPPSTEPSQSRPSIARPRPRPFAVAIGVAAVLLIGSGIIVKILSASNVSRSIDSTNSRLSLGRKILLSDGNTPPEKQIGSDALKRDDYPTAIAMFIASLKKQPNDPEALIYLNNAKANSNKGRVPIRIAIAVPILSNRNVASEMLRGVAQAQNQVNLAGGLNGTLLEVEIASDENDTESAKQSANELVKDDKVKAVVGHNSSEASLAAADIYNAQHLVMITPTSFADRLTRNGDYIFRTGPNTKPIAKRLAEYVRNVDKKTKIAVCYDSRSPDNAAFEKQLELQDLPIVPTQCDLADPAFDPNNAIQQALNKGADGLLVTPHIDDISKAIDLAKANHGQLAMYSSPTMYTYETLNKGREAVSGLIIPTPWHPKVTGNDQFVKGAQQWGGQVNWRTASSYDAAMAIFKGLETRQDREGLQKTLRDSGFSTSGASQEVRFDSLTGDRANQMPHLIQVQKKDPSQSRTGYDFVPLN
ncbi:ABC transporter substrate-binding protein [Funiculus sociatus GB2-M2]|uniref:ABC transporter substrate-binding protein n=1 Tax=Funiculus sociatus TaxID=450527 RepID=UPI00329975A2